MKNLVWNENEVLLNTSNENKDYAFHNFTGNLVFYSSSCQVTNATFILHIKNMSYLDGEVPFTPWGKGCNTIEWIDGIVENGDLYCKHWENGTFNGNILNTDVFKNGTFNGIDLNCGTFENGNIDNGDANIGLFDGGIFSGNNLKAKVFQCGRFDGNEFTGEWRNGVFINGNFKGDWYGGTWKGGEFNGKSHIGDGTLNSVLIDFDEKVINK